MANKRWNETHDKILYDMKNCTIKECAKATGFSTTVVSDRRSELGIAPKQEQNREYRTPKQIAPYPKDVWYG